MGIVAAGWRYTAGRLQAYQSTRADRVRHRLHISSGSFCVALPTYIILGGNWRLLGGVVGERHIKVPN